MQEPGRTGCAALPYSPAFKVTATRDKADRQVALATTVTQGSNEAPNRSVSLAFPTTVLAPNLASIQALCLNLASGSCQQVGSANATSPLYPATLRGKAYLTVAIGCTGGRHRSVALVEELKTFMDRLGLDATVVHRDMDRE